MSFNGVAGVPTSWSETTIQVPVPEGATSGPVVVTVGDQASPGVAFRVLSRLTLTIDPLSVSERPGDNAANVEVSVEEPVAEDLAVTLHHPEEGTVDDRRDYSLTKGVVIPQGSTLAAATLAVGDDAVYESDETVEIRASARGYGDSKVVTVALRDNDEPLTLTVTPLSRSEGEGERTAEVTVSVVEPAEGLVRVFLFQQGGNADSNTDYALVDNEVWIQPKDTSVTTTLEVIDDTVYEEEETVVLLASTYGYDYADSQEVTVTIEDDDPRITGFSPDSGLPGDSVTISGDRLGGATAVTFAQGENRVAASSFTVVSDTEIEATVPAGATTGPIEVTTPAATAPSASPFTVLRLFLATSQSRVAEPNGTATLTVSVLKAVPTPLTVTLDHPGDGNADPATDYRLSQTVVTIPEGGSSATVELTVTDDASYEKDETIEIRASAKGYLDSEEVTVTLESEDPPPLTLTVDPLSLSEREGERTAEVTVSVEEPAEGLVRVFLFQQGGNADSNTDYALVDNEVWIQPAGTLVTTTLEVIDDAVDEEEETVVLLASTYGPDYADSQEVTVRIEDDDTAGVTVTPTSLSLNEEGTGGTYQVSLDSEPTHTVTITIDSDNPDLEVDPASLSFGPGNWSTPRAVTVEAARDDGYDDESGTLTHEADSEDPNYEGIAIDGVTVAVDDNEPPPLTLTADAASVSEPNGTVTLTVTVPEGAAPPAEATITLTHSGSASNGPEDTDYTVGTLTIAGGDLSGTARLAATDDTIYEGPETIRLKADHSGYKESEVVEIALIDDELPPLTLTADAASVSEPNGTTTLRVTVPEGAPPPADATITLTHSGSASNGTDYTVGTLTIMARDLSGTATLRVRDDTVFEGTKTIALKATHSNYQASGVVEISLIDDEQKLMLTVAPQVVSESTPNRQATVTVSVLRAVPEAVEVTLNRRGTAESNDYRLAETVTIPAGGTSALPATLTVVDDGEYEVGETIELWATATASYEPSDRVKILIEDNEPPQPLAVSVNTHRHGGLEVSHLREGEPLYDPYSVTVSVPQPVPAPVEVALNRTGTADEGDDYRLARTVTIPKDMTSVETPLTVIDDEPFEVPETLTLQATTDDDGYVSSPVVTVTIYDDNFSKLTLSAEASTVSEPNGTVRVTASVEEGKELAADATVFLGFGLTATATHKTDFRLTKRLTLPAEQNSVSTVLTVIDDGAYEGDERIELLASGDGTSALSQSEILTIQLEDDDPAITDFTPKRGGAGVVVTISGDNLAGATAVRFGEGETSEIEGDSDTEIRAPVPAGATTGPITVVTPAGTATSTGSFTVRQLYLEVDPASVGEAAGQRTATVTVRVNEAVTATEGLTVTLAHPGMGTGKATRDTDYTLVRTVTIANTKTSAPVATLTVVDDGEYEGEETILLQATAPDYGASREVTVTVEDDDPTITDFTPKRGAPGVVVTISGDNFTEQGTTVQFNGVEVEASKVTVDSATEIRATVPPGAATGPITVVTPAGTATSTGIFTVRQLYLEVDPASVGEAAGQRTATVTVRVNEAVTADGGLTVTLAHPGMGTGKAARDTDYTLVRTVTIAQTRTSAPVATLTVVDDGEYEGEETILLQATAPDYGASNEVTVTVEDDDPTITDFTPKRGAPGVVVTISGDNFTRDPTVQFNGVEVEASKVTVDPPTQIQATVPPGAATGPIRVVTPGGTVTSTDLFRVLRLHIQVDPAAVKEKAGGRTATVTVSVDDAVDQVGGLPVTFTFGGTADRGRFEDYTMDQTVTIPNGKTSAPAVTLTVRDDRDHEEEETITIQAGADGYEASEVVEVTLISDDLPELILACPLSLSEEAAGTENILVYLPFTRDVPTDISFAFKGTATRGTDYTMDQMVTIDAGSTSAEIPLTVIDDRRHEGDETIDLEASADGFQTVFCVFSIEDTDPVQPPLTLSVSPASVGEASGNRTATVTVSVDEAVEADGGLPVTFTFGGTADRETDPDYTMDQTVTILNTKTSAEKTLTVVDDAVAESDETITITAGATDYSDSEAVTVTIADDDVPGVTVTEASLSITEGKSGTYQVKLDTQPTADVTITVTSSDEGAVTVTPASLTFTAGNWNTARAVTVEAVHDEDIADETATLTHVAAGGDTNYAGIDIDSVSVSVTDDEVPGVTVTPTRLSITEGGSKSYQVKLKTRPSADVTISMSSSNSDVQVPSTALTFTTTTGATGGWDQLQSVRVRIAHDDNTSDESGTITHSATSDDTDYDGIAIDSVSVSVSDDDEPNRAPVCQDISDQTVTVHKTKSLTVSCTDGDGHSLAYEASSTDETKVTASINSRGVLTLTGVAVTGSSLPTVTVTVSDGEGGSTSETFTVTVKPEPPPCTLTSIDNQTVNVDASKSLTLSSSNCGDNPTYSATSSDTSKVTESVSGSSLTITGVAVTTSPHPTVTVTVSGGGQTDTETFTVTVKPEPPRCTLTSIDNQTVNVDASKTLTLSSSNCGDNPTYSATSSDTSKVTESVSGSSLTITGVAVTTSPHPTVTVTVSGGGQTDTETFTVTVPNLPPVCDPISDKMVEKGDSTTLNLSTICRDPEGGNLTYGVELSNPSIASDSISGTTLTISWGTVGETMVTITATDAEGQVGKTMFTVTVKPPPCTLTSIDNQTVNVDASKSLTLSSSNCGDNPTYSATSSDTSKVTVTVSGSSLTITGVAVTTSPHPTVTVTVSGGGQTDTETFTVTVKPEPPRCTLTSIDNQTVNVDASKTLTLSSSNCGDNPTYSATSSDTSKVTESVSGSSLTITGVAVTTSPHPTVTVTVSGGGQTDTETFTVTVPNLPPVCDPISDKMVEKGDSTTLNLSTICRDPEGGNLTYGVELSNPSIASDSISGTTLTISWGTVGETMVTITATDAEGQVGKTMFTVTVKPPPCTLTSIDNQTVNVDASKSLTLSSSNCGDNPTYSATSSDTSKVTVTVSGSSLTITGVAVTTSPHPTVTVTVSGGGQTDTETFTVTVKPEPPRCTLTSIDNQTVNVDASKTLTLSSSNCGDNPTYSATSSDTSKVTESVSGSSLTITGVAVTTSPHPTVTVTVSGGGQTDTETFTVTVPNLPPVCDPISDKMVEKGDSTTLNLSTICRDPEGGNLTYGVELSNPSIASDSISGTTLTISWGTVGETMVTITATDAEGQVGKTMFTVTVKLPPCTLTSIDNQTVNVDASKSLTLSSSNCGDNPTYSATSSDTSKVTESVSGSSLTITGVAVTTSPHPTVTVTVSGGGQTDTETFTVTVPNLPPVCDPISDKMVEKGDSTTLNLSTICRDPEGGNLTYGVELSNPSIASDSISGTTLTISWGTVGETMVTITATDAEGQVGKTMFTVTVKLPPCTLTSIDNQTVNVDASKSLTLSSSNCGDNPTYSATSSDTSKVTESVSGSSLTITGVAVTTSPHPTVTVTVSGGSQSDTETFTVTVTPLPKPVIYSISPSLQRPDDPVTISGNHFGSIAGSVSFGGYTVISFNSWSNTSISLLIPGSLSAGQVSVTVTTHNGMTSNSYPYTVTGDPVQRDNCEEEDDCPDEEEKEKEEKDSEDTGETEEDPSGG